MKKGHSIHHSGREIVFPATVKISFAPVIASLRKLCEDEDQSIVLFASNLLSELKSYPILEEGFSDYSLLKTYEKPIAKLLRILFPDALSTNEIKGVTPPFEFKPFFMSTRFRKILEAAGPGYELSVMNFTDDEIYIFVCCVILVGYYHYPVDIGTPFKLTIPHLEEGIDHAYRVAFNAEMISVSKTDEAPEISREDYNLLIDHFNDIKLWKEKFPPGSYILSGIGIANLMDITVDESIAGITTNLLARSEASLDEMSTYVRRIFRKAQLRVGYINYEDDLFSYPTGKKNGSILLDQVKELSCNSALCPESYEQLINSKQPLVITDTERYQERMKCILSENLIRQGVGSYIIIPLVFKEDFLGFMELASENKYELSEASIRKLADILPVISMALSRFKTETKNEMDAVIQQEFTQIHSSVKWRFEEEAKKYIHQKRIEEEAVLHDLDFPDIFPFFGQLDVKGSSTIRNEVIQKDIHEQLTAIKNIIARARHKKQLPLYEELVFRIDHFLQGTDNALQAGSEHELAQFLKKDIYPVFEYLKETDGGLAAMIRKYEGQLDPNLKMVYHERKKFDRSITVINKVLTEHLDKRQQEAQQMFPHYFERYKTDGVEYNMYVGASIAKGFAFNKIYVHNLRLWQLMIMSELENEFSAARKYLEVPLEIASLIMVHSDPLSIQFRVDEKKFDIKGAYNARYEIIKKRIDKANIKGTEERITAPGKLAIVYSNDQDADQYTRYINFLASKGYFIKDSLEKLELEDLQGITGLQALRVEINYGLKNDSKAPLTIQELVGELEGVAHSKPN